MKFALRTKKAIPSRALILAAAAVAAPFIHTYYASAFQKAFGTCNGSNVIWRETVTVSRNSCSIRDTNPVAVSAFNNSVAQWDNPSNLTLSRSSNSVTDCSFDRATNDNNEVSLVNRSAIDGNNGLTFSDIGACFIGANDIDEADATIANDMDLSVREGNVINPRYGRSTFVHEMGHFIGLGHVARTHAVMDNPNSAAMAGGNEPVQLWPDDANGLNALYGLTGSARSNLIVSSQQWVNGPTSFDSGVLAACRGQSFSPTFFLGNSGNAATGTYNIRIRLSTAAPFSGGYTGTTGVAATFTHSLPAFGEFIGPLTFTIPSTLPINLTTPYNIYIDVDFTGGIAERNEGDNVTVSGLQIRVQC